MCLLLKINSKRISHYDADKSEVRSRVMLINQQIGCTPIECFKGVFLLVLDSDLCWLVLDVIFPSFLPALDLKDARLLIVDEFVHAQGRLSLHVHLEGNLLQPDVEHLGRLALLAKSSTMLDHRGGRGAAERGGVRAHTACGE
jgi:hypothetical protein